MIKQLHDYYLQNNILEYIIYPLPYLTENTKNEIKIYSSRKINAILFKKYKIKNNLCLPFYIYDENGHQICDFNVLKSNEKYMFIAFI